MDKRKVYLLLIRFPDTGSRAVRLLTGCQYPHASIGLDEDRATFYSFVTKGFIVEKIHQYSRPGNPAYPCQLYELEVTEGTYMRLKRMISHFVQSRHLLRYTKLGAALSVLQIPYRRSKGKYFCSQFVAEVLQRSGAAKLRKQSHYCFADDLKELPGMKLDYQGDIQSMLRSQDALALT